MAGFAINTLSPKLKEAAEFNLHNENLIKNVSDLSCDVTEKTCGLQMAIENVEYCSHSGTGIGKILVIGNSIAVRAFPQIFQTFNGSYVEIRLFARHDAAPLLKNFPSYNHAAMDMARQMKPDLIWIIQGMNEIRFQPKSILRSFPSKVIAKVAQQQIKIFKNLTGKVYVDLPYFIIAQRPAKVIARSLFHRKSLEEKLSVSQKTAENQIGEQKQRLRSLDCKNCEFIDIQKALTTSPNRFYFYDRFYF